MSNVLNNEKKQQVIALGRLGWTLRRIGETTGVRRETASGYLKAAGVPLRPPRGWGKRPPSKPANEVTPDFGGHSAGDPASAFSQNSSSSTCEAFRDLIESALSRGRNAMGIWQDLVDEHGFRDGYQSVKRFVRKLRGSKTPEACGIIITAPGEEARVDYGTGPMVRDPDSGKHRRTRLFVLTPGCSRKAVRLIVFRSGTQTWAELHEQAFRRLGGVPRVVVPDNLLALGRTEHRPYPLTGRGIANTCGQAFSLPMFTTPL